MITTTQSLATSKINQSDWYFVPTMLNGTLGIIIGLAIAPCLNLIEIANFLN